MQGSNSREISGWADIFEDKVLVSALLDRLLHHVVIFTIIGESYRIKGPMKIMTLNENNSRLQFQDKWGMLMATEKSRACGRHAAGTPPSAVP